MLCLKLSAFQVVLFALEVAVSTVLPPTFTTNKYHAYLSYIREDPAEAAYAVP